MKRQYFVWMVLLLFLAFACGNSLTNNDKETNELTDPVSIPREATMTDENMFFRATGNEPGWLVKLHQGHAVTILYYLDMSYGAVKYTGLAEQVIQTDTMDLYNLFHDSLKFTLKVIHTPCFDDADLEYTTRVFISKNNKTYPGCGGYR